MDRETTERFINENFGGIIQDWPWKDTPEYAVFRHAANKKWFALVMTLNSQTLIKQNPQHFSTHKVKIGSTIDIINLKSDPDLIEHITREPGVLPAYHMNKRHWITVLLDGTCPRERLQALIDLSYRLTMPHSAKPQSSD